MNGDGIINETDFNLVSDYSVGKISLTSQQFKAADINKDGNVDTIDAAKISKYISNGTPLE